MVYGDIESAGKALHGGRAAVGLAALEVFEGVFDQDAPGGSPGAPPASKEAAIRIEKDKNNNEKEGSDKQGKERTRHIDPMTRTFKIRI